MSFEIVLKNSGHDNFIELYCKRCSILEYSHDKLSESMIDVEKFITEHTHV